MVPIIFKHENLISQHKFIWTKQLRTIPHQITDHFKLTKKRRKSILDFTDKSHLLQKKIC